MSKQTKPILAYCRRPGCSHVATIGVYMWAGGESDVNLNNPIAVMCGRHKPKWYPGQNLRNVKLARRKAFNPTTIPTGQF